MGNLAAFSFYPTKNLGAMGDAGAVVTSCQDILNRMKKLHQYGWTSKYKIDFANGRNSRIDEMQAAILTVLLGRLDSFNQKRINIWQRYKNSSKTKVSFLDYQMNDYVGHLAVAKVEQREEFIEFMKSEGIAADVHYPILDCDQLAWKELPYRIDEKSDLAVSRKSVTKLVSLPLFPLMTEIEIGRVCDAITKWESC